MNKLALAAIAATFAFAAVAPASAEEGRHEGMRHRDVKEVIVHRDHGRHEGWRHSNHYGAKKTVVIKHGNGSKTIIKKREG
jgi:hypothetical protein